MKSKKFTKNRQIHLFRYKNIKIIILILSSIVVIFVFIWILKWRINNSPKINKQQNAKQNESYVLDKEKSEKIIAQVSGDNIYDFQVNDTKNQIGKLSENTILESLQKDSLLLQTAQKEGLIKLPSGFFNAEYKKKSSYQEEKNSYLNQIEKEYEKKAAKITGHFITVFFYNQKMPTLPFEEADKTALDIIEEARNKVVSKEWTPETAILELSKNKKISLLDFNYLFNTGIGFKDSIVYQVISQQSVTGVIKQIPDGKGFFVSEVYRFPGEKTKYDRAFFEKNPNVNGYYMFLVITNKTDGYYESFNDWKESIVK